MAVNELTQSHHSPPLPPLRKHVSHCFSGASQSNLGYNMTTNKVLDCSQPLPKIKHFSTKDPSRIEIHSNPLARPLGSQSANPSLHSLKSSVMKNDCSHGSHSASYKELPSGSCGDELPKLVPHQAQQKITLQDNFTIPVSLAMLNKNEALPLDVSTENFIKEMQRPEVLELVRKYNPYPSSHLNYNRDPSLWKNLTEEEYNEKIIYNQRVETHCQRLMSEDKLSPATAYALGNIITQLELHAKLCEGTDLEADEMSPDCRLPFTINPKNSNTNNKATKGETLPLKESKHKRSESIILNNNSAIQSSNQGKTEEGQATCSGSSKYVKGQSSNESSNMMVEASELGAQLWRSQMEQKWCHSHPLMSSEHTSRLDPHAYQSYAAGILHSSKRSDKFLRLQKCFTILNRIAKIEKQYNITSSVLKKSGCSNVPQRVRQVLKQLYTELDEAQSKNEFFFSSNKSKHWTPDEDYELKLQQKSLKDRCAVYDLHQKSLNANSKQKPGMLYDIKRELSFDELFAKYQDLDRELIREKMSHASSLPNLGQETRKSTPPPGAYLQIQENCSKLSKVRAIHGTYIDDVNNFYEIHVNQHSPNGSLENPPLHIRSESVPYHNAEGKQFSVLQRSDSCKESFFNFPSAESMKEKVFEKDMTEEDATLSSRHVKVPLPSYKDEIEEELVVKSVQNKSKSNQGSYMMKNSQKKSLEDKTDGFYNSNNKCSSLIPELKESRFKNASSSSDSSGNLSDALYSKSYKPSICQHVTPQPYRPPVALVDESVLTKPVFQVRDVKSFITKDNEFVQSPYFEVSKSCIPSSALSSLAPNNLELTKTFNQNIGTKELTNNFPPLSSKNTISLNDISHESVERGQLSKSWSMPYIALNSSAQVDVNHNNQKRPANYTYSKTTEKKEPVSSKTESSDINSDLSRSYHSFQARNDHECEGYKPPKEILNDMLHVVQGYNILADGDFYIKNVDKEVAIKYLDNLGQEWKNSQQNNLRGQDLLTLNAFAKSDKNEVGLQEHAKIKNTTPCKEKFPKDKVPPPPPLLPPPPPPKPQSSAHLPPLPKSLLSNLEHGFPSLHDYKPLDCSTPTLPTSSALPCPLYPGTVQTLVPGQAQNVEGLSNASQRYMVRSQNAVEDGLWEMTSRMTTATPNGVETATNTHQPPANTGD